MEPGSCSSWTVWYRASFRLCWAFPRQEWGCVPFKHCYGSPLRGEGVAFFALRVSALPGLTVGLKIPFCFQINENRQSKRFLVFTWGSCCYQEIWFIFAVWLHLVEQQPSSFLIWIFSNLHHENFGSIELVKTNRFFCLDYKSVFFLLACLLSYYDKCDILC